jgi:hypothetical protein
MCRRCSEPVKTRQKKQILTFSGIPDSLRDAIFLKIPSMAIKPGLGKVVRPLAPEDRNVNHMGNRPLKLKILFGTRVPNIYIYV